MALGDKPGTLPEWASGGAAEITEPGASAKSSGFVDKQKPAHQHFNWFFNLVWMWLAWVAGHKHDGTQLDKIDLATETNLTTAGQPLRAPGHAVAWIVYNGDGTVMSSFGVDVANSTLTGVQHSVRLSSVHRTDLSSAQNYIGPALATLNAGTQRIPEANYRRDGAGHEEVVVAFENGAGVDQTLGPAEVVSVIVWSIDPNGIG